MRFNSLKYLIFLLLCICAISSHLKAENFVVTSNADNGVGTLREALTKAAANGNSEVDLIQFNLPGSTRDHITIKLQSVLPIINSNIIIDGSTQPSGKLGVSDARVILSLEAETNGSLIEVQGASTFEVYGLMMVRYAPSFLFPRGDAIYASGASQKLTIGAPGKGNVIAGFSSAIRAITFYNFVVQGNFIGVADDGLTPIETTNSITGKISTYNNSFGTIGGTTKAEGNLLCSGILLEGISHSNALQIGYNSFGTNYSETNYLSAQGYFQNHIYLRTVVAEINNNVFSSRLQGVFLMSSAKVILKGNFFGVNRDQTIKLGPANNYALQVNDRSTAIVGGENIADQNVFTGYFNPIIVPNFGQAKVLKNNFYCNQSTNIEMYLEPDFRILGYSSTKVSGVAAPGAMVQIYSVENSCGPCNPFDRIAVAYANSNGKWEYNGALPGTVMASATLGDQTIGFVPKPITEKEVTIIGRDCNRKGSIEIVDKRTGDFTFTWKDISGNVIGNGQKIENLEPGTYFLEYKMGDGCTYKSSGFWVRDLIPVAIGSNMTIPCGLDRITFNGTYTGAYAQGVNRYFWENENGQLIANTLAVTLTAGKYYFYVQDLNNCFSNKAQVIINASSLIPVVDATLLSTKSASCNASDAFIRGVKVVGGTNVAYRWRNQNGTIVGNSFDLENIPKGRYRLEVSSDCATVYSNFIDIDEINSIVIDQQPMLVKPASCGNNNGSISMINVQGSGLTYTWFDSNGNIVGNELLLSGVSKGTYKLRVATNSCFKETSFITILETQVQPFPRYSTFKTDASCSLNNGSIFVDFNTANSNVRPASLKWKDDNGNVLGTNATLSNLSLGKYHLYLTDGNGCEQYYGDFQIGRVTKTIVKTSNVRITNDECGRGLGKITGIEVSSVGNLSYVWKNRSGAVVGTQKDLSAIKHGEYSLTITDDLNTTCSIETFTFTVNNNTVQLDAPQVPATSICAPGAALIRVNNSSSGEYLLYDDLYSLHPISISQTGVFSVNVNESRRYYISVRIGNCESSKSVAELIVAEKSLIIPNSFTPNGDGVNDIWNISGVDNYPEANLKVYNRNGNIVFDGLLVNKKFDGFYNGVQLPVGVYYYVINLREGCKTLTGPVTIIR